MKTCYWAPDARGHANVSRCGDSLERFYIHNLEVAYDYRCQGYGTAIMEEVCRDADAEGVSLGLWACSGGGMSDYELIAWYQRFGFEVTEGHCMERQARIMETRERAVGV